MPILCVFIIKFPSISPIQNFVEFMLVVKFAKTVERVVESISLVGCAISAPKSWQFETAFA